MCAEVGDPVGNLANVRIGDPSGVEVGDSVGAKLEWLFVMVSLALVEASSSFKLDLLIADRLVSAHPFCKQAVSLPRASVEAVRIPISD